MITAWTKNLRDPEEIKKFQNSLLGSKIVLRRLEELLREELSQLDRSETDPSSFDSPNWAYHQAFKNGSRSRLELVLRLISLDPKD